MEVLKSLIWHARRGDVRFGICPKFHLRPWSNWHNEDFEGLTFTHMTAGWLWVQCRWMHS